MPSRRPPPAIKSAHKDIGKQMSGLKKNGNSLDSKDIFKVIENLMTAIHGDLSALNLNLFADFESMKNQINTAKAEISALRTDDNNQRVRVLKITGLHDLQTRAGEVEKAVGESNDQKGDLLAGIRDGLSAVRDRPIHMKIEG